MAYKKGDKIRIMTSSEYKKYVANHDVPDLFTGTFAEKYMGKQGLIEKAHAKMNGVTWYEVPMGRSTYHWPEYVLIKLSDAPIKGGFTSNSFSTSGGIVMNEKSAKRINAIFESPQKYAISSGISAEEMQSRLTAFKDKCFKKEIPHEEKAKSPLEVTEIELNLFGLSKMDALLWAIADPTLEVEVNIRRKKSAMVVYKKIELHDADSDKLVSIEVNSIEDHWLITKGDEEREKHPKANAIIRFDDGLTGLFRESPIQIRKKIREASLC